MIASASKLKNNDPDDWICGRAGEMKKIIGSSVSFLSNLMYLSLAMFLINLRVLK